ncbi:MAG: VCBS repeat-containing protein [Deltaproteobacteria bacterium]|nr:VCBS repeat-containing protein [Deltaproteobacteria bacterium]
MKKLLFIFFISIFYGCTVGDVYSGHSEGEECSRHLPCADGLHCQNGYCVDPDGGIDGGEDIIGDADSGADIEDISDVSDISDASLCGDDEIQCGSGCCSGDEVCIGEQCIETSGECETSDSCPGDTYCSDGFCIPWGTGPGGTYNPECGFFSAAGLFQPVVQCQWAAPPVGDAFPGHVNVLSTPLVADFNFDNDSSVRYPSIVFVSYNGTDGSSGFYNGAYGVIRVLDGRTCEQLYNVGTMLNGCNTPAIADLDGDGRPEIIAHNGYGGVEAFTYDANSDSFIQLWHGHDSGGNAINYSAQSTGWSGVSVHDINDDGLPEVISFGMVYDNTGLLIESTFNLSSGLYYPAVADIDRDGEVEITNGNSLYSFDLNSQNWVLDWSSGPMTGNVAYGDFGTFPLDSSQDDRKLLDGIAEIVLVGSGVSYILNSYGRVVFGPISFPAGSGGGPPTVGDYDGDGRAEFSAASSDSITVFDPDCTGISDINYCVSLRTDGILWAQVSQDHSSNRTGSSLFDFEGDSRVEVVYADEVFTRVYDGRTGEVVFSQWHSSCTWNENPIVADVDGDFNAELVVPSNVNCTISPTSAGGVAYPSSHQGYPMDPLFKGLRCEVDDDCMSGICDSFFCRCTEDTHCGEANSGYVCDAPVAGTPGTGNVCRSQWLGAYSGIKVYADTLDRWVASRTIWNQHTYSVTNISEDGTVPSLSSWVPNWFDSSLNNFRQNVQGDVPAGTAPDITLREGSYSCDFGTAQIQITMCNRGTQPVGAGVPVTIYDGENVVCETYSETLADIGQCIELNCDWDMPPATAGTAATLSVNADTDSSGFQYTAECIETNNQLTIPDVYCTTIGK